jgi:hypothetical protein
MTGNSKNSSSQKRWSPGRSSWKVAGAVPERPFGRACRSPGAVSRRLACAVALTLLCGLPHAFAQSAAESESAKVIARIHEAEKILADDAGNSKLSPDRLRKLADFLAGNMSYAILRETGHALIADMGLPVLGAHGDAADTYATIAMLTLGTEATQGALTGAAMGWFYSDRNARTHGAPFEYYDIHGLDVQRAYKIVCLMVGSDPDKFQSLAEETNLPEERRDSCQADFADAKWSWVKALTPSYRKTPDLPRTTISVAYGEAKGHLDVYRRFFQAIQMSEITAGHLADAFLWRAPLAIDWETCGQAGAHWQVQSRKLLVCYELADEFARLYRDYGDLPIMKRKVSLPSLRCGSHPGADAKQAASAGECD